MLKHRAEQIQITIRIVDILICVLAFLSAYYLRYSANGAFFGNTGGDVPLESFSWLLAAGIVMHTMTYAYFGFYESIRSKSISQIILMVLKAFSVEFFVLGSLVFLVQAKETSRYFFFLFLGINHLLSLGLRVGAWTALSTARQLGYNFRQVLIVGTGQNALKVIRSLKKNSRRGYIACGILSERENDDTKELDGVPVLGRQSDLASLSRRITIDEVFFAPEQIEAGSLSEQMQTCEEIGIPVRFSLSVFEHPNSKVRFAVMDNIPFLTFYRHMYTPFEAFSKRCLDIVISLVGLGITSLLFPWIAFRIKQESPGPVFFRQTRVGENGRTFLCYKFRTMSVDAEEKKVALMDKNEIDGPIFKMANDPRVFPFGSFLRQTSLDELPQFWNILKGEMSVVGSRPHMPHEVENYALAHRRRLSIRPGLTGNWQVNGRSSIKNFEDAVMMDLEYIDNWSIWLDLKIIFKTVWAVLARRGAH